MLHNLLDSAIGAVLYPRLFSPRLSHFVRPKSYLRMPSIPIRNSVEIAKAGPVSLLLILGILHRSLRTRGFTLRGSMRSTDILVSISIFCIVNLWTLFILLPIAFALYRSHMPRSELLTTLTAASSAPWLAEIFSLLWITDMISSVRFAPQREFSDQWAGLWKMDCSNGPFGWRESLRPWALNLCFACMAFMIIPLNLLAIYQGNVLGGSLSLAALALFVKSGLPHNKYHKSPHKLEGDRLRIALPTSHLEGTIYVLPSRNAHFQAHWSPKIEAEHIQTDSEMMTLFNSMRSESFSLSEPLRRLRTTLSAYNERVILTDQQVNDLAEWLLLDSSSTIARKTLKVRRPPNVHLIGRDLMYALVHAEYLVFIRKNVLPPRVRDKLGVLRDVKRSGGLDPSHLTRTVGYEGGFAGYQEAVRYIYALFNQQMDPAALNPPDMPIPNSRALGHRPSTTEEYVGRLWTLSLEHSESTFSALYMFCCIWFMEVGNIGGFHIFPFASNSHQGDRTAWQIVWRQGWYECLIAQSIAYSPLIALGYAAAWV